MRWPDSISHNIGWKVVSIALATLIWLILDSGVQQRLRPSSQRIFSGLQITVLTTAADNRAFTVEPAVVEVTVGGDPDIVENLRPSDVVVFVDLTTVLDSSGLRKRIRVVTPPGVSVTKTSPADVLVRSVPVRIPPASPSRP